MHGEMDITQFHPLRINLIRVFFEALCVRLGKVDDFKRGIGNCKDGDEHLVLQALFADIIADRRYVEILKDTPLLLHACKDIIQKLSKDEKANKCVSEKEKEKDKQTNNDKENAAGKKPPTIHHINHEDCLPGETHSVLLLTQHIMRSTEQITRNTEQIMRNTEQIRRNTEHIRRNTEHIMQNKVNTENAARNYSGNEVPHINNPGTTAEAFKISDDVTNTIHSDIVTFANLLLKYKDDEVGFWAGKYEYYGPLFAYIYRDAKGKGIVIQDVAGMSLEDLRKAFPREKDVHVLSELDE
ncbi:MAG: hypothetical protein Q9172_007117 [Xanthocarpia lactea]